MLNKALRQFACGEIRPKNSLAAKLDISEMMLDDVLGTLAAMGYIERIEPGCSNGRCGNCFMKDGCKEHKPLMWVITEKGNSTIKDKGSSYCEDDGNILR